ncbi:MAG: nucleotidyltransferase family protein [Planctomycetota bacterium]|nr:nucleotidyltransferase family protein [Planctomycetota bacterium]
MSVLQRNPVVLLLAAGEGSRLGEDKMFVDVGGRQLIERSLRTYRKAERASDVIIVVPGGAADRFAHLRSPHRHIVENPDPSRGMISSIRAGLESGWAAERDFLVAPADVPFVDPALVDQLVTTFTVRDCRIALPSYRGLGGHPGLYHHSLSQDFFLSGDTSGAREILLRYQQETVRMNVHDPDVCFDIDTPEDLEIAMDAGARWARVEQKVEAKQQLRLR